MRLATRRGDRQLTVSTRRLRETPPRERDDLRAWVHLFSGLELCDRPVCQGHSSQMDILSYLYFERPASATIHGSRGSGKSLADAVITHLLSRFHAGYGSKILAGSLDQAGQVYGALDGYFYRTAPGGPKGNDGEAFLSLHKREALYRNRSRAGITSATSKGARGPHVPLVILDELDEMLWEVIDGALGMGQADRKRGQKTTYIFSSTWHRSAGSMARMLEKARERGMPRFTTCVFDVLEHCPDWRSGPRLENCPSCPIQPYCWEDIDGYGRGIPKAKRAAGYYAIDDLISKVYHASRSAVEADYLCRGPQVQGLWFSFRRDKHLNDRVPFRPDLPLYLGIDTGPRTAAVWFQVHEWTPLIYYAGHRPRPVYFLQVLAEYYREFTAAFDNAEAIRNRSFERFGRIPEMTAIDPSGDDANAFSDRVVNQEYERAGWTDLRRWERQGKLEKLNLIETFLNPGAGDVNFGIRGDCTTTIDAFENYKRDRRRGEWLDFPVDPQHPHENPIDALSGAASVLFPNGLAGGAGLFTVHGSYA